MMTMLLAALAQAADPASTAISTDEVIVTAPGKPFRIEVEQLRRGQAAFAKDHARYAPQSTLHFRITPRAGGTLDGFQLSATDGHRTVPVPLAASGDIVLPDLPAGDWSLIGSRSHAGVGFRIMVLSPGSIETDKRLGDLRLQCRVGWAVIRSRFSIFLRGAFDAAGGCGSSHFAIYDGAGRPIETAMAQEGARSLPLKIGTKGRTYQMPLADKTLGDDARVRIAFK